MSDAPLCVMSNYFRKKLVILKHLSIFTFRAEFVPKLNARTMKGGQLMFYAVLKQKNLFKQAINCFICFFLLRKF